MSTSTAADILVADQYVSWIGRSRDNRRDNTLFSGPADALKLHLQGQHQMKQRRRKSRKQSRKPTPPTSTPPLDWQTRLAEPAQWIASPGMSGTPLPLREAADQARVKADMELNVTVEATVVRTASHKEMLSWIEVLEALIVELPKHRRGMGHNLQLITEEDVQEITEAIAILKAQPVVPTAPDEARAAGSTLMRFGERLGKYLLKQADVFVSEAVKSSGKEFGKRLIQSPFWLALATALMVAANSVTNWLH